MCHKRTNYTCMSSNPLAYLVWQVPVEEDSSDGACAKHQESRQNQTQVDPSPTPMREVCHPHQLWCCAPRFFTFWFIPHSSLEEKRTGSLFNNLQYTQSMIIQCSEGTPEGVSWLVFWAKSTTKDYITAKNNVQSVFYLLCTQVIKPQIIHKPQNQSWHKLS